MRAKLLTISIAVLAASAFAAVKLTPETVLKDAAKHDGKKVTVTGKVDDFRARTSRAGNKYFTFKLKGTKESLSIYGRGELKKAPKDGDRVEITGTYRREKKVNDNFTAKNEVDVSAPRDGKGGIGVKILK